MKRNIPENAIDGNSSTYWVSPFVKDSPNNWIGVSYTIPVALSAIQFVGAYVYPIQSCGYVYHAQYSDDGNTWYRASADGPLAGWNVNRTVRNLTITEAGTHKFWRVYCANTGGSGTRFAMYELSLIGSIGSIVPVDIMYSAIMDCQSSGWGNLNSITLVNNPDGGHIWYSLLFGSEYRVWTGAVWLAIARNNSGTWEYWDGAAWQAAQINSAQTAISDAMAMAGNRMFGETLAALVDADFAGTYPDGLAVTLFTSDSANNPKADSATFDVTASNQETVLVFKDTINPELPFSPVTGQAIMTIIPGSGVDLAADVTMSISKDGGTTFAELSLGPVIQDIAGSKKVCGFGDFPAGTDKEIALKITAPTGKRIEVDVPALFGTGGYDNA